MTKQEVSEALLSFSIGSGLFAIGSACCFALGVRYSNVRVLCLFIACVLTAIVAFALLNY